MIDMNDTPIAICCDWLAENPYRVAIVLILYVPIGCIGGGLVLSSWWLVKIVGALIIAADIIAFFCALLIISVQSK